MEEKIENYNELLGRLKSGNRSTFRNDLEMLARHTGKNYKFEDLDKLFSDDEAVFWKFSPLEHLAKLSSENEELLSVVLQMIIEPVQQNKLWNLLFHSTRYIGPKAISHIREEWQRNGDSRCLHFLHMCLMDIVGSITEEERPHWIPIIAEREIPLWSQMMQTETPRNRALIASLLGAMAHQAPAKGKEVGELIMSLLYYEDDGTTQTSVISGLLDIGDKSLLQDALFRMARVARDPYCFEFLVSALKRREIDINTKDESGKTALTYANDLGNEKLAEILKNAGADG